MTKKDYKLIANAVNEARHRLDKYGWEVEYTLNEVAWQLCNVLKVDNPLFNDNKFYLACGLDITKEDEK